MNAAMQDTIERELLMRAPRKRVYAALTEPEQFKGWFAENVEGSLAPGEKPILDFGKYGKYRILVVAADPYDYFAYRWTPGAAYVPNGYVGDPEAVPTTLVEFRLEDAPEGTRVKLKESGFASLPAEFAEISVKENNEGWDEVLPSLAKFVEKEAA